MLLKILLLQVMSIGLITVPIKAQDSLVELPGLYMEDSDKDVMTSIWNIAGYPGDHGQLWRVERKFLASLGQAVPVLQQVPFIETVVSNLQQQFNINQQHKEIHQAGGTYAGSPTTINYKELPKPPNSELNSSEEDDKPGLTNNRRTLHPENVDLEITDNDKETNAGYYPKENLETDSHDTDRADLVVERMGRMMQFEGADDNIHMNDKPRNFLRRKSHQNINDDIQSHDTNTDVHIRSRTRKNNNPPDEENPTINRNSHMGMHKKKHNRKTDNKTRNSETSTHLPTVANPKYNEKRKESNRKSNKTPETRKYYEMLENNKKYLCKCNVMSDETMKDSKSRKGNQELNDKNSYTERSVDIGHDQSLNCSKYCNVTEENDDKTKDTDNLRMRSRHDKGIYHKDKRNNAGDDSAEQESVDPKAIHSRKYRNKHTMNSYVDDSNYRSMRNVNPSE